LVAKPLKLRAALITAGTIFLVDVFFLDQGILTLGLGLFLILLHLILAGIAFSRDRDLFRHRLRKSLIYLLMIAAVFCARSLNYKIAASHLRLLADACNQYRAKTKHFPDQLQVLVPDYLPKIPQVKYVLNFWNQFTYSNHTIIWVSFPPSEKTSYNLETDTLTKLPN